MRRFAAGLLACFSLGCSVTLSFDDLASGGAGPNASGGSGGSTILPVNCPDPAPTPPDPKCTPPHYNTPGAVGSGIVLPWGPLEAADISGGFAHGEELVVAVDGDNADGILLSVDLDTGDRTLVSGSIHDITGALQERGSGLPSLAGVTDVARMPDGAPLAITFTEPRQLIRVDPSTGDRTELLSWSSMPCARPGGGAMTVYPQFATPALLEVTPNGDVYLPFANLTQDGFGILRWKDGACEIVSYAGGSEEEVGGGPSAMWRTFDLRVQDQNLYLLSASDNALFRIDLSSGNRYVVSRRNAPQLGAGDAHVGQDSVAPAGNRIWTIGPLVDSQAVLTEISASSGDRVGHAATNDALFQVSATDAQMWIHPSLPLLILEAENGVVLYDPAADKNNLLSY